MSNMQYMIYRSYKSEMSVKSFVPWKLTAAWATSSSPLKLVNVESEFEGGAKLQSHVFHHHVTTQQQERFAINLLQQKGGKRATF